MTKILAISRGPPTLSLSSITGGNTTLTLTASNVDKLWVGMIVTGDGIPALTRITAIASATTVTLSSAATNSTPTDRTFEKVAYNCPTNPKLKVIEAANLKDNFIAIYNNAPVTNESNPSFTALNNTAMNGAITVNSNVVTVASTSALYVGQSVISTSDNFPINTVIEKIVSSTVFNTNNDSTATVSSRALKIGLQISNLETTSGFRLKCHDAGSGTGFKFTETQIGEVTNTINNYYFVLIHSDNYLKHHFARITEIHSDDTEGDSFDFEPKLGNEIPINTKFKLFSFPIPTYNHPVAISAGVLSSLNDALICSNPLFYFFDEYLDKKNELDHNEKYAIRFNTGYETSAIAFDSYFMTMPDYGTGVVDYSKYSMSVKLVDRLKDQDDPLIHTSNEGVTITAFNPFDRDSCFLNAKRDGEGALNFSHSATFTSTTNTQDYVGPDRYLQYDYSPTISNFTENVFDCVINESVGSKGGYAEVKIIDTSRMLVSKIPEYSQIRVRHSVHRGSFFDWMALPITITAIGSHPEYSTHTDFDISNFLNVGDEVKVGDRILIVKTIDAFSAFSQDITFEDFTRLETQAAFTTTTYELVIDDVLYRRAYNHTDSTLLTDYPIFDDRSSVLYVVLGNSNLQSLEATVTSSDAAKKLITLSFLESSNVIENSLTYASGSYTIEIERLNGEIERMENVHENGNNIMHLTASSQTRKLISPIINKNTLFSQDIIYSSDSPYNKLTPLLDDSGNGTQALSTFSSASKLLSVKTAADISAAATITIALGTTVYGKYSNGMMVLIGRARLVVSSASNGLIALEDYPRAEGIITLYKEENKHYMFNKALASNVFETSTSSLDGVSNKGLYFESGSTITNTGVSGTTDGQEDYTLIGTSISANTDARGYYLSGATKLKSDSPFQAKLDDGVNTNFASFDTVNTLMDFTVVSVKTGDNNTTVIVAPYIPLTLGRVDINYANMQDTTTNTILISHLAGIGTTAQNYLQSNLGNTGAPLGDLTDPRKHYEKPIYVDGVFVGFFVGSESPAGVTRIYLDRKVKNLADNATVTTLDYNATTNESSKLTHELNFLNGGHLHTGKTIGLLHPSIGAANTDGSYAVSDNTLSMFDYPLSYTEDLGAYTYSNKFGSPYYRLFSIEKGNFNLVNSSITGHTSSTEFNFYGETLSKVKYYSTAYRFNPGFYIDGVLVSNIVGTDITCAKYVGSTGHDLVESRGHKSPLNSRYLNTTRFRKNTYPTTDVPYSPPNPTLQNTTTLGRSPYIAEDVLDNRDPKISRMFLFSNCDLLPYSGSRIDSLFNINKIRDLTKYNIMLIDEPTTTTSSDTKTNLIGETSRITSKDSSYTTGSIISSSKEVGSGNTSFMNFSVMRLTEMVLDFAFNQFDPENPPSSNRIVPTFNTTSFRTYLVTTSNTTGTTIYSRSISTNVITCSGAPDISADDTILDSAGRFIGVVASVSGNDITLDNNAHKTINTSGTASFYVQASGTDTPLRAIYSAGLVNADSGVGQIRGHGKQDTFLNFNDDINLLKSIIMTDCSTTMYGKSGSAFHTKHTEVLGNAQVAAREGNIWLPIDIDSDSALGKLNSGDVSPFLAKFSHTDLREMVTAGGFDSTTQEGLYHNFMPVILNRFAVEEGETANADIGMCCPRVLGMSQRTVEDKFNMFCISLDGDYASKEDTDTARTNLSTDADGVLFGFKPLLKLHNTSNLMSSDKGPNNTTIVRITIPDTQAQFLSFVDLTGCYLAPENGKYISKTGDAITEGTHSDGESLNGVTPNTLLYVLSHELDISNTTKTHIITVDSALVAADTYYRILQPNHTCFYANSPTTIRLNEMSSKYTKEPYSTSMYNNPNSYFVNGASGARTLAGEGEAVLSMYVIADPNDISAADHVVIRSPDKLANIWLQAGDKINEEPVSKAIVIADGESVNSTSISFSKDTTDIGYYMEIGQQKEMIGIPSMSEPIELTIKGDVSFDAKRAIIGSVVTIGREAEDLIEETLEENNINFSLEKNVAYPFFLAPNFQGVNLFTAINFLMLKKNKMLNETNGVLTIIDRGNSSHYSHVNLSPKPTNDGSRIETKIDIFGYEKVKTMFDFYNHIVILGKEHKGQRKNLRSINKHGLKSLQEYDVQLVTQEDVDKRATQLLILHSEFNFKINVDVGHKGLGQLRAGDIVSLELSQENIRFAEYLVIEITHTMTGMLRLQLGKYSKQLEDRFAEISVQQDRTTAAIRNAVFDSNVIEFDFLEKAKIKLIKFVAQKRHSPAGITLGFSGTLNTSTNSLGFVGAGTIATDLLEEEF